MMDDDAWSSVSTGGSHHRRAKKSVCSRATASGRITLANGRLIVTTSGHRDERGVADAAEYLALLRQHFGVELGPGVNVARLLHREAGSTNVIV